MNLSLKDLIIIFIISALVTGCIISSIVVRDLKGKLENSNSTIEFLQDSIITWKDKDGNNRARIQVLELSSNKSLLSLKTKDSTIIELQNLVKEYKKELKKKGSVTVIDNTTDIDTKTPTIVVGDSIYPTYKSSFNLQGWVIGSTTSNKDSTLIELKVRNKYSLVIGEESQGWFKPSKPFAEVKNFNPYTETTSMRSYQVSLPEPKKFGIGIISGYMVGSNFTPILGVGIGISYNLIRF